MFPSPPPSGTVVFLETTACCVRRRKKLSADATAATTSAGARTSIEGGGVAGPARVRCSDSGQNSADGSCRTHRRPFGAFDVDAEGGGDGGGRSLGSCSQAWPPPMMRLRPRPLMLVVCNNHALSDEPLVPAFLHKGRRPAAGRLDDDGSEPIGDSVVARVGSANEIGASQRPQQASHRPFSFALTDETAASNAFGHFCCCVAQRGWVGGACVGGASAEWAMMWAAVGTLALGSLSGKNGDPTALMGAPTPGGGRLPERCCSHLPSPRTS